MGGRPHVFETHLYNRPSGPKSINDVINAFHMEFRRYLSKYCDLREFVSMNYYPRTVRLLCGAVASRSCLTRFLQQKSMPKYAGARGQHKETLWSPDTTILAHERSPPMDRRQISKDWHAPHQRVHCPAQGVERRRAIWMFLQIVPALIVVLGKPVKAKLNVFYLVPFDKRNTLMRSARPACSVCNHMTD
jgi:hypothetical protein